MLEWPGKVPSSYWVATGFTAGRWVHLDLCRGNYPWHLVFIPFSNGVIRQYLPKGSSMHGITQLDCSLIAEALNARPRKRLNYRTPQECFDES